MRKLPMLELGFVAALAVMAWASGEITFETSALDGRAADSRQANRNRDIELPGKATLTDAELVQTHARPLFSQDRRPFVAKPVIVEQPVVQVAAIEQPVSAPRRLALLGTNVGGAISSVLVRNQESSEVRWLKIGESFDGWILSTAAADQATFICEARRETDCEYSLSLYVEEAAQ